MKHLFHILSLAVSAALVLSCAKSETSEPSISGVELQFIVKSSPLSKTFIEEGQSGKFTAKWHNGDELGMFFGTTKIVKDTPLDATLSNTKEDGPVAEFTGSTVAEGEGEFYSFVPAASFEKGYADGTIGVNIGDKENKYVQHPSLNSFDPSCDLLVAAKSKYLSDGELVVIDNLPFKRMLSILRVNLVGEYAQGQKISSFKLTAPNDIVLGGRAKVNLVTAQIPEWTSDQSYISATYSGEDLPEINGENNSIYLIVNPCTVPAGSELKFEAESEDYIISKTIESTTQAISFPRGNMTEINLTIAEANCTSKKSESNFILSKEDGAFVDGGQYILALKDGNDAGKYHFLKAGYSTVIEDALTVSKDGKITSPDKAFVLKATAKDSGFTLMNEDAKNYLFNSGSKTTLNWGSNATVWVPTFISESKAYTLQNENTSGRYVSVDANDALKAYALNNFKDQIASKEAVGANSGALSVFVYDDGRAALDAPDINGVEGNTLSWSAVENAGSYDVTIGSNEAVNVTATSYTFTGKADYYDVAVSACPADATKYRKSDEATATGLKFGTPAIDTPELISGGVTTTSVKASWTADAHASSGYECSIYDGDTFIEKKTVNTGSVLFEGLTRGKEYTVKVKGLAVAGDKPYAESAEASINLTPEGIYVKDLEAGKNYTVTDLVVYAVPNTSNALVGDGTGFVILYNKSGHGLVRGNKVTLNGAVKKYNGVLEFDSPTISDKVDEVTVVDPEPVAIPSDYADNPKIIRVAVSGTQSGKTITTSDKFTLSMHAENTDTDGFNVKSTGYAYGYNSSNISYFFDNISIDPETPITASASSVSLGSAISSTAKVTVKSVNAWTANTSSDWTVSPTSGNAGITEVTITASKAGGTTEATLANLVFTDTVNKTEATVTVKQAAGGVTTVTQTSFSTVNGSVNNDSNISYAATKGDGTTAPAINNGKIRIYKPASGKSTGGILTITANNNKKIKSIIIKSNRKNKFNIAVDGVAATATWGSSSPYTCELTGLSATTVSYTNINTDSNDISYISVTYE